MEKIVYYKVDEKIARALLYFLNKFEWDWETQSKYSLTHWDVIDILTFMETVEETKPEFVFANQKKKKGC
jgi:hypothetical protein